jgi:hypothetical protein
MAVFNFCGDRDAVDGEICYGAFAEIEENRRGSAGMKLKVFVTGCRRRAGSEREAKVIANVGKLRVGPRCGADECRSADAAGGVAASKLLVVNSASKARRFRMEGRNLR